MSELNLTGDIDNIPTEKSAFKKGMMSIQLANIQYREWFTKRRESVAPWGQFFNTTKFKAPKTIPKAGTRIVANIDKFQSNYLFVFLGLVAFSILTSPLLLIAIAASLGACYIVSLKNAERPLSLMGKEVPVAHQYAGVAVLSFPVFWLAGAGGAIFWLIGASVFVIMIHATMFDSSDPAEQFEELQDLQMEEV